MDQSSSNQDKKKDSSLQKEGGDVSAPITGPLWTCSLDLKEAEKITVGQKILMNCHGDRIEPPLGEGTFIQFAEKSDQADVPNPQETFRYVLRILKVNESHNERAQFVVTSYKAGEFKMGFRLSDNRNTVEVQNFLSLKVDSVLPQGETPKPYPPVGPFVLSYPFWIWSALVLPILFLLFFIYRWIRVKLQIKKMREKLKKKATLLSPYHDFHKESRLIRKEFGVSDTLKIQRDLTKEKYLQVIEFNFKKYLSHEFLIPADEWTLSLTLKQIQKQDPKVYLKTHLSIKKAWVEFERLIPLVQELSWEDLSQIDQIGTHAIEEIHRHRTSKRRYL